MNKIRDLLDSIRENSLEFFKAVLILLFNSLWRLLIATFAIMYVWNTVCVKYFKTDMIGFWDANRLILCGLLIYISLTFARAKHK